MNRSSTETSSPVDRILVVNDLPDNYLLLQILLESEGYPSSITLGAEKLGQNLKTPTWSTF